MHQPTMNPSLALKRASGGLAGDVMERSRVNFCSIRITRFGGAINVKMKESSVSGKTVGEKMGDR